MPQTSHTDRLSDPALLRRIEARLPAYLEYQRWFTSKGQGIAELRLQPLPRFCDSGILTLLHLRFADGSEEIRPLPLALVDAGEAVGAGDEIVDDPTSGGTVVDAIGLDGFRESVYALLADGATLEDERGALVAEAGPLLRSTVRCAGSAYPPQHSSNSVVTYEPDGFLKLFRKTEPGLHPDAELIGYLSAERGFSSVPKFGGALHFRPSGGGEMLSLGLMLGRVDNRGELWETILEEVGAYAKTYDAPADDPLEGGLLSPLRPGDLPQGLRAAMTPQAVDRIVLLGVRTAEMHLHFAAARRPGIAPEDLTAAYWDAAKSALADRIAAESGKASAELVPTLDTISRWLGTRRLPTLAGGCIRVHGDYHLGQVLDTGDDLVIIDFEGEPLHSLAYRRRRHPAFKDVAGMLRSLHYAPFAHALQQTDGDADDLRRAAHWYAAASRLYLTAYLDRAGDAAFVPAARDERAALLGFFLADKALYELAYERASRPDWIEIPRAGIREVARLLS